MPFGSIKLNDGNEIPAIAFGTALWDKPSDVVGYIEEALEHGFSHIDTSANYGTEGSVGTAFRESGLAREEVYVTTKYDGGPVRKAIQDSLTRLDVKQVDLYMIHHPRLVKGPIEDVWREFEKIKEDGLSRSIGVSNYNVEELQALLKIAKIKPAVNQIFFNPYNWKEIKPIVEFSYEHGIVTEAYTSLFPITRAPGGPVDSVLEKIGSRLGATPAQVIFAWVKSKGAVIVTTTRTKGRLDEYLDVADLPELTPDEIAAIEEAGAKGPPSRYMGYKAKTQVALLCIAIMLVFFVSQVIPCH